MNEGSPSVLLVCVSCREPGSDPAVPRPSAALLAVVRALVPGGPGSQIEGVACLSACKRPCAAALLAPGRVTYLFGDLTADAASASELLQAAGALAATSDGWLPRAGHPERLRAGILARIPPLHWLPACDNGPIIWPA